jgi:hypothetical protein
MPEHRAGETIVGASHDIIAGRLTVMRSALMIAYFFPPEGSAGTYRSLRFVRQLSKMGWRTTVVTADQLAYERPDPALLDLVPSETEVLRVRVGDPWMVLQAKRGRRIQNRLAAASLETARQIRAAHRGTLRSRIRDFVRWTEALYYRPDMAAPWIRPAAAIALRACRRRRPDVIWATVGPMSSSIVARRVSNRTGIPYVLDFRDPWGLDYYEHEVRRPRWIKAYDDRILHGALRGAQAVVFLFDSVAESYRRAFAGALDPSRIHVIPNGYEGDLGELSEPNGDRCTLLYTGNLATYRIDSLLRSLRLLKQSAPALASKLRVCFVGEGTDALLQEIEELGLSNIVELKPPVSHLEVNELQRSAHALLLLGRDSKRRGYELVAGAKLFEYLKARRPIIGVLPRDEGRRVLQNLGVTTVCDVDSLSEITAMLKRVLEHWSAGSLSSLVPERAACEAYSAERQTSALIRALEGLESETPFIPGSVEVPPSLRRTIR